MRAICLTFLACCAAHAQSPNSSPTFEAASVKVSLPAPGKAIAMRMNGGPGSNDPGRIDWANLPIILALAVAYDVKNYQVSGPDWLNTSKFDISATIQKDATKAQFRRMLQKLLAERFQLRLHHENRESLVYALVVTKGGPKMMESPEELAPRDGAPAVVPPPGKMQKDEDGFPLPPARPGAFQSSDGTRIRLRVRQETMAQLAIWLTDHLGHPVTDTTELNGKYDFVLTYAPPGGLSGAASASETDSTVDLIGAMQQAGLKLEPKKAPVDTLVIDHMEKMPVEN
jgi:uncharacterized protein (TIGR03435 family)